MKLLIGLLIPLGIITAGATDWPQFRGPYANGLSAETSVPSKLKLESIAWTADLPGRGLSSPIVIGDRLFVTCSSGPRQDRLHLICFDATTGTKIWERQFWATGRTMCHKKTCVAAPTPASDGQRIFAIFSSNDLVCLDLDGNLLWLRGLTHDAPNASNSIGMSSSLLVVNNTLITMVENDSDSFTAGIDVNTGLNRWKIARPKMANWTSPFPLPAQRGTSLIGLQSGKGIVAVESDTGNIAWEYTGGAGTIPSTTVSDGLLYVPSHGLTVLRPPVKGRRPEQLWRSGQLRPAVASPLVLNNRVYALNNAGVLTCASASEGKRRWQLRLKGPFSATPVARGDYLYCINEKGLVQVVDTTLPEGGIVSELDLGKTILSTPALAQSALFVRSDEMLWRLGNPHLE